MDVVLYRGHFTRGREGAATMSGKPVTPEMIAKLPMWAQEHISNLEMQRHAAIKSLIKFQDQQTKSDIWFEDSPCLGENAGPRMINRYLQTNAVYFNVQGKEMYALLRREADGVEFFSNFGRLMIEPIAGNVVLLVPESRRG